ncbi:MAG: FlgD immunoglobulin-like domain containing protein [Candidatus Desantisbacteria bacterium]
MDGDEPRNGYPKLHILRDGAEISNSPFSMRMFGTATAYDTGVNYYYSTKLPASNAYSYFVEAWDISGQKASGEPTNPKDAPDVAQASVKMYIMKTKWGSSGSGDGQFSYPFGVAVDATGNVFVADTSNNRIQKFASDGRFITKWGSSGSGDGQFSGPYGVVVDASGNVFVADRSNHRIQKFASDGTFVTKWGSCGSGDGQFSYPRGVAVDASGNVFVADVSNHRIQRFTPDGTFSTKWGSSGSGDGQFSQPLGVAVDASGNVFVVDFGNNRIQRFTPDGRFITKWGSEGSGDGQFSLPHGVAVDASGNVFVADYNNNRIQRFTPDGTFSTKWGSSGSGDGQFGYPLGAAVDASGNVFVVDFGNHRIQKFKPYLADTTPPTGTPSTPTDTGTYSTSTAITFSWDKGAAIDAETGIGGYRLQVKGVKGTVTETIFDASVGNVSYTVANVTNSFTCYARVKARNSYGVEADDAYWSDWSDGITIDATPPTGKPATPTDACTYSTVTAITFSWGTGTSADAETGIGGYRLQVKSVKGTVTGTTFDAVIGNVSSYTTVNATHSFTYYARVKARNGYGVEAEDAYWSDWSDGIMIDTIPPTGKPSTPIGAGTYSPSTAIAFSWNKGTAVDAETGIGGYRLQIKSGTETIFDADIGNVLFYTIVNATTSFTYYARVKAKNGCGVEADDAYWSDWSNGIMIDTTPPTGKPATPTNTGTYSTSTTISFSWNKGAADDAETGIGGYRLQVEGVRGAATETVFDVGVGNVLSYTIVNATHSFTYRARVKAKNGYGAEAEDTYWSDWSDGIEVDTEPPKVSIIRLPADEPQIKSGRVTLTGTTESGATLSQITIKDQRGNILLQGKIYFATIDSDGKINITIDSGELARNYPLSSKIVIELTIKDKAGNLITKCSSPIDFTASTGERFTLYNNLFDPTKNEGMIIKYELTENTEVSIMIYDFRGNLVKSLVDSYQCAGIYTKTWNGRNDNNGIVVSGIYLIQIKAGGFKEIKKVAVVE